MSFLRHLHHQEDKNTQKDQDLKALQRFGDWGGGGVSEEWRLKESKPKSLSPKPLSLGRRSFELLGFSGTVGGGGVPQVWGLGLRVQIRGLGLWAYSPEVEVFWVWGVGFRG